MAICSDRNRHLYDDDVATTTSPSNETPTNRLRLGRRWTRHSRTERFAEALNTPSIRRPPGISDRWTAHDDDPNAPVVLMARSESLRQAWRDSIDDRLEWIAQRCAGRSVLDIGCVAHSIDRMDDSAWLHGRIAAVASACVGVDVLRAGLEEMQQRGFRVVEHDLSTGIERLSAEGPYDVIVAGEIIEHLGSLDLLLETASGLLDADGELIITTPNPYALDRFLAGRRGIVWENADHVSYAFPSGIAELAERHGLELREATTVQQQAPSVLVDRPGVSLRRLKRRVTGSSWRTVGFTTTDVRRDRPPSSALRSWLVNLLAGGDHRLLGETFVYVVGQRACSTAEEPSPTA
jgi:2-polyprenyl-3-methyl-5-hydroxy-6-metoxy-1,4-benzoquinol methylase